ncbi:MAG: phenylalanine--tRNA ligase subunit beta [Clostridia bacterium]
MKTPISWLKDYVKIDISPEALADKLVSAGFEVEEIIYQADQIKNVVAGRIMQIEKHPNSDHLLTCMVNIKTRTLQIVTGANNIKVGDIVPVAIDGAQLPNGKRIYNGELRGVKSFGMFCSGSELALTEDDYEGASVDGILILKPNTSVGANINDILGTNDVILDVAVTANRPDCNSILGIAREIAAVTDKPCKQPVSSYTATPERIMNLLDVHVDDTELCPRYIAKAVKNIKICKSPKIVRDRLTSVGIKPINNIVDITNYVLVEIGQPMHAFDYENIRGGKIIVRHAKQNESIVTLNGAENKLDTSMLVIADTERPLAVAGVMGGLDSGISDATKTIIFESANFARDSIRHTARALNLHSDSSARFEKGIDYLSQQVAIDRALTIIQANGWGTIISGTLDTNFNAIKPKSIVVPYKKINEILGIKVPVEKMVELLNSLQIKTTIKNRTIECNIPAFRDDISTANDLAEEIIRLYGYNKIKSTMFADATQTQGGREPNRIKTDNFKTLLASLGGNEIVTYSFISPKTFDNLALAQNDSLRNAIKVLNPLGEDLSVMRTTLVGSMLQTISSNIAKNNKSGILFEVAKRFIPKSLPLNDFPTEIETLSIGMFGDGKDFYSLMGLIENSFETFGIDTVKFERVCLKYLHEGRSANIIVDNEVVGYLGEVYSDVADNFNIDGRVYVAEINLDLLYKNAILFRQYKAIPKYPAISRDLALIVKDGISADMVIAVIKKVTDRSILENVQVFDVYRGAGVPRGNSSIALTLTFRAVDRTLKEDEVNAEIEHALRSLNRKHRVKLRK